MPTADEVLEAVVTATPIERAAVPVVSSGVVRGGHGVELGINERIRDLELEVLSDHWYVLRKATFEFLHLTALDPRGARGLRPRQRVVILLDDPAARTVLLTRQFRLPVFLNGHPDGMLVEAVAGLLDGDDPRRHPARSRGGGGVRVGEIERLFELFMSPGR